MADRRPFEFRVGIDGKDAKAGAADVAQALEDIGRAADKVGDDIAGIDDTVSLSGLQTVTRQMRRSADDIRTEGQRIGRATEQVKRDIKEDLGGSELGSEVGSELAQNIGQSISSGDFSAVVTDSIGGLFASLAGKPRVKNAAAAAGAGVARSFSTRMVDGIGGLLTSGGGLIGGLAALTIGGSIFAALTAGWAEQEAAFKQRVDDLFGYLEGKAMTTLTTQQKLAAAIEGLTEGGAGQDWTKYVEMQRATGFTDAEMVALLTGTASPDLLSRAQRLGIGTPGGVTGGRGGGTPVMVGSNPAATAAAAELLTIGRQTAAAASAAQAAAQAAADAAAATARGTTDFAYWSSRNPRRGRNG